MTERPFTLVYPKTGNPEIDCIPDKVYESLVIPPYKPSEGVCCVICGSIEAKMVRVEYSGDCGWTSYYCLRSPIHSNGFTIARQTENMSEGNLRAYVTVLHSKNMGVA